MQILSFLIVGIALSLLNCFVMDNKTDKKSIVKNLLFFTTLFNVVILGILKFIFKVNNILNPQIYSVGFSIKYIGFALIVGLIVLFFKGVLNGKITFSKASKEKSKKSIILKVIFTLFFAIGMAFVSFANWFLSFFGNITPEQFLFNLKSPLKGTSNDSLIEILSSPVFAFVVGAIVFLLFMNFSYDIYISIKNNKKRILSQRILKNISLILSVICLVGGVSYGSKKLGITEIVKIALTDSPYFEENYKDPRNVSMSFPKDKRNVIHIYLESIENSYLPKELGGYMKENIMPELTELANEGIHFSHTDKPFGGPHQTYASEWSVAGMINMSAGMPLIIPINGNSYGTSGQFLPGAIAMGDILEAQGYNQTIMFGADADFGGLTAYYTTHGSYNIFDYKAAIEKELIPEDYYVWWGFEDDKLYDYAKDEITRLHNEGKPFNFTMETADTHFPDGYLSEGVENKFSSQYANVIAYSTKETVEFIRWIQAQPFYENTTIVLTGDHTSMDKAFFADFDPNYERTTFNLILNSAAKTDNVLNRQYAPFDMFPTILESMGVKIEGGRLGLGTSLFSNEKTLVERDGLDAVNKGFHGNSHYFNDEIINEKKDSIFENTNITEN
ncbi:MAG: LTA synthase family protein [Clostridium sp.]|nr:LTA synthase family protein [Clostridium sp.]